MRNGSVKNQRPSMIFNRSHFLITSPGSMHDTGSLGLVHWDDSEGWYGEGRREGGSGWGTRVYLWWIHVDVWQNQYNIVK